MLSPRPRGLSSVEGAVWHAVGERNAGEQRAANESIG
jgi:hypothetical protein